MKELIPALVAALGVPLQLEKNGDRKGPFDAFRGVFSSNINEFFKRARLNVTIIVSPTGQCTSNGTCDGQMSLLKDGQVDFSAFGSFIDTYTPVDQLHIGPYAGPSERSYQSLPYSSSYRSYSGVLRSADQASLEVHLLQAFFLLCMHVLINTSCVTLRSRPFITLTSFIAWFLGQLNVSYRMPHRVITSMTFIFNSLVTLTLLSCAFNAQMIVEHPAKYYESLEELVKNHQAHGKPVLMMNHSSLDRKLAKQVSLWSDLLKGAQYFSLSSLPDIPGRVARGSILLSNEHFTCYVRAYLCSNPSFQKEYLLLRESPPLTHESTFFIFARNSSSLLKSRVSRLVTFEFEVGMARHDVNREFKTHIAEIFSGSRWQIHRCEGRQRVLKWPSDQFNQISLSHCHLLFIAFFIVLLIGFIVFACELMHHKLHKKCRKQRSVDCDG